MRSFKMNCRKQINDKISKANPKSRDIISAKRSVRLTSLPRLVSCPAPSFPQSRLYLPNSFSLTPYSSPIPNSSFPSFSANEVDTLCLTYHFGFLSWMLKNGFTAPFFCLGVIMLDVLFSHYVVHWIMCVSFIFTFYISWILIILYCFFSSFNCILL